MVEFKRKKGESFESFLRRFNKRLQLDGKLMLVRKSRYHKDAPNKRQVRLSALVRKGLREKRAYERRVGKIKDEFRQW
ncbi:MAG TPA: 30S ribosomal protein S21 [bacterium]|nr:30S ribosomal protein S21 [bacterium]